MENINNSEQKANKQLLIAVGVVALVCVIIAVIGFLFMNKPERLLEGQVEGTTIRVAGKLPGRVARFYVQEGDTVHPGDTLVSIHSSTVEAKLAEVEAMRAVAQAQDRKVDAGTRAQIVQSAYEMVQQAKAAVGITRKTYDRLENLFAQGVVSEQKRDEAKAAYEAAVAAEKAAESQYSMAKQGAQKEDKEAAAALVSAATGGVDQVKAILEDSYLVAPCYGVIDQIYPEPTELVSMGTPIMSVLKLDDRYVVFNVREELLPEFPMGKEVNVTVPGLGMEEVGVTVYYIRDMGSYATWQSTKSTGDWDSRTFQVKARPSADVEGLRPGMTVLFKSKN